MSPRHNHVPGKCLAVREVLNRVGDKWSVQVVGMLGDGKKRFGELRHGIEGISQRMLTLTLKGLERDGLITRTVFPVVPPRVEYELSDRGRSLKLALAPIRKWVLENQTDIEEARSVREQITGDIAVAPD